MVVFAFPESTFLFLGLALDRRHPGAEPPQHRSL